MPLKRTTKSIPLSGGITEEVDDFLLEPAGMQYMENLRFTKQDVAEKVRPYKDGVVTGGLNYTPNPYGIWSQGDTVAVVGNDEVCVSRDGGETFTTTPQDTDLLGIESIARIAEQAGGTNYSWAPVGEYTVGSPDTFVISYYVVAFERVEIRTQTIDNIRDVVIHVYDLAGRLIEETVLNGYAAPKVKPADGYAVVFVVEYGTPSIRTYKVSTAAGTIGSEVMNKATDVQDFCQVYNRTNEGYGPAGSEQLFDEMRLGYTQELKNHNMAFDAFQRLDSQFGAIAWKHNSTFEIRVQRTFNANTTGGESVVYTDAAGNLGKLLDVSTDANYSYVLYAITDVSVTTAQTDLRLALVPHAASPPDDFLIDSGVSAECINGSARITSDGRWYVAVTWAAGTVTDFMYQSGGAHRVEWYEVSSGGSVVDGANVLSHRMCSDLVIDRNDYAYFAAQQWANWNVGSGGANPTDPDVPAFTPTHKKPVTTVMLSCERTTDNQLHATFDAGQSKACLPGEDEQSIHMSGELYYWDQGAATGAHQFWYGNRVVLSASDDFYYATDLAGGTFPASDGKATLHPGESRFSCYHLQSSVYVPTVQYTAGLFMGAAVPAWFDGSTLITSMQPVDSPEFVTWAGQNDLGTYMMYQPGPNPSEEKIYQVVMGFYDDAGLVHRSAPSTPVYVGLTSAVVGAKTAGNWIFLTVTPPVAVQNSRAYFLELYEAWPGGSPQLAATKQIANNNASKSIGMSFSVNLNPTASSRPVDIVDVRAAKTIYTAGNVLAADPWPNFDAVVQSGRRLFAHSISDPSAIYYSKTFENGIAPEFSASLVVSIGNEKITALGAIDDKVIIFTDRTCWVMYGTGPDNTGANGDFFVEKMVFQHGCTDQDSILPFEGGIAFFSSTTKEFHALGRDLQLVDIGENVKVMTEGITDIRDAIVAPYDHELRWYCDQTPGDAVLPVGVAAPPQPPRPFLENQPPTNPVFVYNYKYKKWSVWEDYSSTVARAAIVNNRVGIVSQSWVFAVEDDTSWDNAVLCKWETPWIKVNQLQDFGRFYELTFLGKYLSSWTDIGGGVAAGDLEVTVAYDYESATGTRNVHLERANVDFNPAAGDRLQFRVTPKRQKCQAIKILIEEKATTAVEVWEPTYAPGQGVILTAVDILYGAKGGSGSKNLGPRRRR